MGDIDGDGDIDFVVGNWDGDHGEENGVFLNDGHGHFSHETGSFYPGSLAGGVVEDSTLSIVLGDVDGDGHLDLAVGNTQPIYQNRLLLNDGSGRFEDVTERSRLKIHEDERGLGDITKGLAFGDLDGDGDQDLLCANGWGDWRQLEQLYWNDGEGRFFEATEDEFSPVLESCNGVYLEDIDGDGALDILCGGSTGSPHRRSRMYLNDGGGRFRDVTATHLPRMGGTATALSDFDLDGDLDLVSRSRQRVVVLFNQTLPGLVPDLPYGANSQGRR
jgi:hypothetical protein